MSQLNLVDLLAERSIIHPTRLEEFAWGNHELVLVVSGYRWWKEHYADDPIEGTIRLKFSGLSGGYIKPDEFDFIDDEALEDFRIEFVADVPWAQPNDFSVFCSEPIPDPLKVYERIHDFLAASSAFKRAEDFLNQGTKISSFKKLASSTGFLVGHGPEAICALMCDELVAQGVRHNVIGSLGDDFGALLVTLGDSSFVCQTATADLDWK